MGKALFWLSIFIGGLVITRILARKAAQHSTGVNFTTSKTATNSLKTAEQMVRCEHCGLHLPRSEATITENQVWCSQEHARLGAKQQQRV